MSSGQLPPPLRSAGFNPIRHDCVRKGCYLRHQKPHIEMFAEDLPGRIAMGDIDGTCEINNHFIFLEFKGENADLTTGQKIYHQRLTLLSPNITTLVVQHYPPAAVSYRYRIVRRGVIGAWQNMNTPFLKYLVGFWGFDQELFEHWADEAQTQFEFLGEPS